MKNAIIPALVIVFAALLPAGRAAADLCPKCKGKAYIMSVGKCVECGGFTSSGAFKLCRKCSARLGQCEHCRAKLAGAPGPRKPTPQAYVPRRWVGRFRSNTLRKHAPADGYVDRQDAWEALWKAWRKGPVPKVDFGRELVVVATVNGPNLARISTKLQPDGNLRVLAASTKMGGPGFGYGMATVRREGVRQVNGRALRSARPAPPPAIRLGETDDGKTVSARVGQQIVVSLAGNPTTGYSWALAALEGDAVRQVGKIAYRQRPTGRPMVGVGGTFTATFQAAKVGKATIRLAYRRPWEKGKAPVKTFALTVEVAEGGAARVEIQTRKSGDRVEAAEAGGKLILEISSSSGIGGATLRFPRRAGRKPVVLRFRLKGLEKLSVSDGKVTVGVSVLSHGENRVLRRVSREADPAGKQQPLKPGSPYWTDVEIVSRGAPKGRRIPIKDGYIDVALPEALLGAGPTTLTVSWIDFYR